MPTPQTNDIRCSRWGQTHATALSSAAKPSLSEAAIPFWSRDRSTKYKVFSAREARIVHALAETVFPDTGRGDVSVDQAKIVEYLDELLSTVELREQVLMRCMFTFFEVQSLAFHPRRPNLFSRLTPKQRARSLEGWDQSDLYMRRLAFQAMRSLMIWAYVDNPDVEKNIGIERGTAVIERLQREGWTPPACATTSA